MYRFYGAGQYDVVSSIWSVRRSATDAKLAGLCGGVAQQWGVDPLLVRVGCALLALSGGIGLVLYFAGWLFIPVAGRGTAPIDDLLGAQARKWPREVWVVVVVIACVAVFAMFGALTPFGIGPAIILAVIWYFGFYKQRRPPTGRGSASGADPAAVPAPPQQHQFFSYPGPATAFTRAAEEWRARVEEHARQQASQQQGWTAPPATNAGIPEGPRVGPAPAGQRGFEPEEAAQADVQSTTAHEQFEQRDRAAFLADPDPVGLYAEQASTPAVVQPAQLSRASSPSAKRLLAIALIAVGLTLAGLGTAAYAGTVIPLAAYFAAALLVLGLSLVAATWFGRARGLLSLAVVALIGVLATSAVHASASHLDLAPATRSYTRASDLPAAGDSRDLARLTVDLSRLDLSRDATYQAHVDLGTLTIVVPPTARVRVDYTVDTGAVRLFGANTASGTELHQVVEPEASTTGQPTLDLELSVNSGTITVRR